MRNLEKFGDAIVDLDQVFLLNGDTLVLSDGSRHNIGGVAADAMRELFAPSEKHRLELLRGSCGKSKGSRK